MSSLQECITHMDAGITRVSETMPGLPVREVVLLRLLLMTSSSVVAHIDQLLKPYGMSDSDFRTLMMIYSAPDGRASPSELCDAAQQGATNMTRIANVLVKLGFITRAASAEDRRRIELSITPAGKRFARKLLPTLYPRVHGAFASLSAGEKKTLDHLLRRVAANIDNLTASDPRP
ncbi:MarR family winged helix-turn-helix transcriptional regulator [Dyella subtropica]|uniref:MarR family winged helix-turn-helix transcriptional regulator n=1 Tax=Dyella subtropica TaxID=2992127 RepID=UPI002252F320|nr:MarR family transcriptional regulator [Dyella subtropica]